jgi:anti-sigma regulatory factor (Ser/Thr protein kinase)
MSHILTIPLSVEAPRRARRSFDRYTGTIEEALLDDLRLLSSEIVTNAVQHSRCPQGEPLRFEVTTARDLVRVDVIDGGKRTKAVRPRSQTPPSGLQYVELLSDRWSSGDTGSFRVWFEIDTQTSGLIGRKQPPPA